MDNVFDRDSAHFIDQFYLRTVGARVVYNRSLQKMIEMVQIRPSQSVIDLGCGSGLLLRAAHSEGVRLAGIDTAENMLALAKREVGDDVLLAKADAQQLPFADATFDVALSRAVIQHVPDPLTFLREAHRILKPGGRLVLLTPFTNPFVAIPRAISLMIVPERKAVSGRLHPRRFFLDTLRAAGFHVNQALAFGLLFYALSGYGTGLSLPINHRGFWERAIAVDEALASWPLLGRAGINLIIVATKP